MHRRRTFPVAAAGRPGRPRIDANDLVPGVQQGGQNGQREFSARHENKAQAGHGGSVA
jgi:hypothetical protein